MTEFDRLVALNELDLLDTSPEKEYDDLVRLASVACGTPISLISLVDEQRQWFKATIGLDDLETPRDISFCAHAIRQSDVFIVEDAARDSRFAENRLVTGDPHLRFYAGVPLQAPGGAAIGTLCVIDTVPRQLSQTQKEALIILGAQVESRMSSRLRHRSLQEALADNERLCSSLATTNELFLSFMTYGPFASYIKEADGTLVFYNRYAAEAHGVTEQEWIGRTDYDIWPEEVAAKFRSDDVAVLSGMAPVEREDVSLRPDGSLSFWKTIKFPYFAQSGKAMLAGISMDVTAEVMREAELEDALRVNRSAGKG